MTITEQQWQLLASTIAEQRNAAYDQLAQALATNIILKKQIDDLQAAAAQKVDQTDCATNA